MYQPIADLDKWDNATKRYYKEKIEVFIKTVMAVSIKENISLTYPMMKVRLTFL